MATDAAILMAGIPAHNATLYRRIRFSVGDPAALIELPGADGRREAVLILRDIEMDRARQKARADRVACPRDYTPASGLSGDRETATAQAVAECLRRAGVKRVIADRSLPLIFAHHIQLAGLQLECDLELGVRDRRAKDAQEVEWLRHAQRVTEQAMEMACQLVARASAAADGTLTVGGQPLTSERVRSAIDVFLLERGFANPPSIVAGGPQGGDCHELGSGVLRTGQPVIVDIFPADRASRYNGDCTRTVVHGDIPPEVAKMHQAVVAAKRAAVAACRPGLTGEGLHAVTSAVIREHGYPMGFPPADAAPDYCGMVHGTGHGVGLEVHEPPLLDVGGPELVVGDCLTIEPGLYSRAIGGVRVEDMVIVTAAGCDNLNSLPEGLDWR